MKKFLGIGGRLILAFLWSLLTSVAYDFNTYPVRHLVMLASGGVAFLAYVLWEEANAKV